MIKFRGKWFDIERFNPKLPTGKRIYFERMRRNNGVMVVPFFDAKNLLMIRQYQAGIQRWIYQFPVGGMDKGEGEATAAKRELEEETGYMAAKLKRVGVFYPDPGVILSTITVFAAVGLKEGKATPDEREVIEVHKISLEKIQKMINSGKIMDGRSIAAFNLAMGKKA